MDNHPLLAYGTLAASATSGATTITLVSASLFPDPSGVGAYNIAIWPLNIKPTKDKVATQVTNGGGAMPAFKDSLDPKQIDAVADYVSSAAGK